MTEENTNEASEEKTNKVQDLVTEVADQVAGSTGRVRDRLVESMVESKLDERVGVLDSAFKKRAQLEGDAKKIKPKAVTVDADGKALLEGYSPADQQSLKKLREKQNKLQGAMERALTAEKVTNEFDKLAELLKKLN